MTTIHGVVRETRPVSGEAETAVATPAARQDGLSLGDRACLALAMRERSRVLTADRAWSDLDLGVELALIR